MELAARWAAVAAGWDAPPVAVERVGAALVDRYREAHRRYHTVDHLRAVLDDLFVDLAEDPTAVSLAVWFHDAVYDPRAEPGANEAASAELAATDLAGLGAPPEVQDAVGRLVRLTAEHRTRPDDPDGAVLCDADLAILAAPGATYGGYVDAVRSEYGWLSDGEWRAGRSRVLGGLLERPWLYATARGRERWERAARANVGAELARLLAQT
jgi:predicted metal-dependent HD superfamily phosphohydrolase